MTWLIRLLTTATIFGVMPPAVSGQAPGVLHVKVVLVDAERKPTPVPRHALLISDNPATAEPRRVLTAPDGTVEIRLRPGTYTVESDRPVVFNGQAYQWTQMIEIAAGQDAALELTADNAEVEPAPSAAATPATSPAPPLEDDPSFLLPRWQDSVVTLWTATSRLSGFVIDARGLVATSKRALGDAAAVEVQLTPSLKVAARVLAAEPRSEVALLWIDPAVTSSHPPVPLQCGTVAMPPIEYGQELFTIAAPRPGRKGVTTGNVSRVEPHAIWADFRLGADDVGGPVFTAGGGVVGISSLVGEAGREESWVVPTGTVCDAVKSAEKKMRDVAPPSGTHLPVESVQPFPASALEDAARRGAGTMTAYQMSSDDFDITFITPVVAYAARQRADQFGGSARQSGSRTPDTAQDRARLLTDFGGWSDYAADLPPVLLVRVTPRLVEGFWKMLARGAASTQGMSLPPMKSFKPGFARLRALCGATEVTPIHPFTIEQRISAKEAIHEGLYAFDPGALTPECGTVKLVLFSEKAPEKGDTRLVDPKVVQQVWQDFAPLRTRPRE